MYKLLNFQVLITEDYDSVIESVTEVLKAEGFGILTQIDIKKRLRKNWMPIFAITSSLVPVIHLSLFKL